MRHEYKCHAPGVGSVRFVSAVEAPRAAEQYVEELGELCSCVHVVDGAKLLVIVDKVHDGELLPRGSYMVSVTGRLKYEAEVVE